MRVRSATFEISAHDRCFTVVFEGDLVRIRDGSAVVEYKNVDRKWKPCATHCESLVQLAFGRSVTSKWGQQRARETKPNLRLSAGREGLRSGD